MNVSGEREKLWVNHHEREDGSTWNDYAVSVSSKNKDGSYKNVSVKMQFAKSVQLPEVVHNGSFITYRGFMTVDSYTDRNGNEVKRPMVMVMEATIEGEKKPVPPYDDMAEKFGFDQLDEETPFN